MASVPKVCSFANAEDLANNLRGYVLRAQNAALDRHESFRLAVSGGSLPNVLAKALLSPGNSTPEDTPQFSKWHIFFADERVVPLDHEDSNYLLLKNELVDKIPAELGSPKIYPIDFKGDDKNDEPKNLADLYQEQLKDHFAPRDSIVKPTFDLILLGCGPDGHTCSLFPGHELLREEDAWVSPETHSPKPPANRITLTLPVVTQAVNIAFVATGAGKNEILHKIFEEHGSELPSALVNQRAGEKVTWFTDLPAVEGITSVSRGSL